MSSDATENLPHSGQHCECGRPLPCPCERILRLEESEASECQLCEVLKDQLNIAIAWIVDDNQPDVDREQVKQRITELLRRGQ